MLAEGRSILAGEKVAGGGIGLRRVEAGECSVAGHGLGLVGWWCWREGRSMLAGVRWLNMDLGWRKVGLLAGRLGCCETSQDR